MATPVNDIFNKHRLWALLLVLISAIFFWYAVVLLTNSVEGNVIPNKNQWYGFALAVMIAVLGWVSRCLTIIPD